VARGEGLTARRVRQIVAAATKEREAAAGLTHAHMQVDRLGFAMRVAAEAMALHPGDRAVRQGGQQARRLPGDGAGA